MEDVRSVIPRAQGFGVQTDILINNAGTIRRADAVEFTEEDWDVVMHTNLKSVFFLCQNFAKLQAEGHPKWREVDLALPNLGPGWIYYPPTTREIRACLAKKPKVAPVKPVKKCSAEERILGLCN